MKKYLLIIAAVAAAFVSCNKDNGTKRVSANITITAKDLASDVTEPETYKVTVTNAASGLAQTVESENNIAVVSDLVPGIYNINVAGSCVSGAFSYTLSGSASNIQILEADTNIPVEVTAVKSSALIFKELYYGGCKIGDGDYDTYFRDQFYEIYNNSDETVYADNLCIFATTFANYDFSVMYEWDIENPEKYIYAQVIWQIPGDGKTYPVKPGESFIIAQWGTNHKAENLTNGKSPVDLSKADFEAITESTTLWNGVTITDGPATNMAKAVNSAGYNMPQWLTPVSGTCMVIAKPSQPLRNDNFITATNSEYSVAVHEIAIADVIDAVESIADETRIQSLGLPSSLDAGYIWCSGTYTGESISRKIKETREDGRIIYQDTNNTCDDFTVNSTPVVRRNNAGVPSWSIK